MTNIEDIIENFEFLDDWEDRYRYVIELGREMPNLPAEACTDANKVQGCVSQVWLVSSVEKDADGKVRLTYQGDSDAFIVRGLVAILLAMVSGKTAQEILDLDVEAGFGQMGLREHLTPQRSNGLTSMVNRIRRDAEAALAAA